MIKITMILVDFLTSLLQKAHLLGEHPPPDKVIEDLSLDGIAEYIKSEQVHNIIVMAGAGISTCKYYNIMAGAGLSTCKYYCIMAGADISTCKYYNIMAGAGISTNIHVFTVS